LRIYQFRPKNAILLTKSVCERILNQIEKGVFTIEETLDLGISKQVLNVKDRFIYGDNVKLPIEIIERISLTKNYNTVYAVKDEEYFPLQIFIQGSFYKLKHLEGKAPTLEINGIHMHRIKDIDPWYDSFLKVKVLSISNSDRVLDLCTGLGYTAIHAFNRRPAKIITIEKDINVLKLAEFNSWSKDLENITIVLEDLREALEMIWKNYFNKIIYDPPSFRIAEELYSESLYKRLYSVLRQDGIVFHYIGYVGEVTNKKIISRIKHRCKNAGFRIIKEFNYGLLLSKR